MLHIYFGRLSSVLGLILSILVHSNLVESFRDLNTSSGVHDVLRTSDVPVLVMLYMHGCRFCQELDPTFQYLEQVFPDELSLLKVDGKRATSFVREMGVRSFPDLVLFDKSQHRGENISSYQQYLGRLHGSRELGSLASFVSKTTGLMAHWPKSSVHDLNDFSSQNLELLRAHSNATHPSLLVFVSPWMDPESLELFNGEQATSILDKIATSAIAQSLKIQVYRIDASSSAAAAWTNEFRIRVSPTVVFLIPNDSQSLTEIRIEWRRDELELRERAQEVIESVLTLCAGHASSESHKCLDFIQSLPGATITEANTALTSHNQTELGPYLAQFTYDEDDEEEEWLFDSLREV
ncbi:LANO_0B04038g1_1 [Lachancea nothofagi CBS 11611]|uniref:LANO_0B04038g1_1 n=1 Tax=Lachancea nothofagi CBS 11611 TaxID=1266666 RepID=A0A1G4IXA6_9SACH|nr:LANO_0B04038g1_1 [Lachancea nothofagi CBS 11611]